MCFGVYGGKNGSIIQICRKVLEMFAGLALQSHLRGVPNIFHAHSTPLLEPRQSAVLSGVVCGEADVYWPEALIFMSSFGYDLSTNLIL